MAYRLRLGGHPLHPLLVHFPIALWSVAVAADIAGFSLGHDEWWLLSFGCQVLGVLVGGLAMLAGFLDYAAVPRDHPAQDPAVWHMLAMSSAWALFLLSLALRGLPQATPPTVWATVAALSGFASMMVGGWWGGQLVYRYGVGVEPPA